jgi:hypothetical protein
LAGLIPTIPKAEIRNHLEVTPIPYYALDLEQRELDRTLQKVMTKLGDSSRAKPSI